MVEPLIPSHPAAPAVVPPRPPQVPTQGVAPNYNPPPGVPPKAKAALSLSMAPDVFGARLKELRDADFALEEKAMTERQTREKDLLTKRHAAEKAALDERKKSSGAETDAMKQFVEMWKRHDDESQDVPDRELEALKRRQESEHVMLIKKTGYDVRPAPMGDTSIPGFSRPSVVGQPWIRPAIGYSRLHPEI